MAAPGSSSSSSSSSRRRTSLSLDRKPLSGAADLDRIHRAAKNGGGTYAAAMTALVTSDLVLKTRTEPDP